MKIDNFKVYDLEESIVASGFPMKSLYDSCEFDSECGNVTDVILALDEESASLKRACKLAKNAPGTGHNNFLSGILVAANVTATNVWWMQLERYHFVQIVSMQSKMHRLREMMNEQLATFHPKTKDFGIDPNDFDDEELAYSCPMGLELTARITTNYLQLKTIYGQRKAHKLQEWRDFCAWIENLPLSKELIIG